MQPRSEPGAYLSRLRSDSTFYLELQYCNDAGISHSEFLNWEPSDRAKALAFLIAKGERCQMCGTAQWEWDENPHAYEAVDKFCKGCYAKASAQEHDPTVNRDGHSTELAPTGTVEHAQRMLRAERRYMAGDQ